MVQLNAFLRKRVGYLNSLRTGDQELDHRLDKQFSLNGVSSPPCLSDFAEAEEQNTPIINSLLTTYKTRLQERLNQERKWPSKLPKPGSGMTTAEQLTSSLLGHYFYITPSGQVDFLPRNRLYKANLADAHHLVDQINQEIKQGHSFKKMHQSVMNAMVQSIPERCESFTDNHSVPLVRLKTETVGQLVPSARLCDALWKSRLPYVEIARSRRRQQVLQELQLLKSDPDVSKKTRRLALIDAAASQISRVPLDSKSFATTVNQLLDELSHQYSQTIPPWSLSVPDHQHRVNTITRLTEIREKPRQETVPASETPNKPAPRPPAERMNSSSTTSDSHSDSGHETGAPTVSELSRSESQPSDSELSNSEFSGDYRMTDSEEEGNDVKAPLAREHTQALSQIQLLLNQHQGTVSVQNDEIHRFLLKAAQVSPTQSQDSFSQRFHDDQRKATEMAIQTVDTHTVFDSEDLRRMHNQPGQELTPAEVTQAVTDECQHSLQYYFGDNGSGDALLWLSDFVSHKLVSPMLDIQTDYLNQILSGREFFLKPEHQKVKVTLTPVEAKPEGRQRIKVNVQLSYDAYTLTNTLGTSQFKVNQPVTASVDLMLDPENPGHPDFVQASHHWERADTAQESAG